MRIVFLGTPHFAVASLDALVQEGFKVVGVVTAPDRPAGRGRQLRTSAVKEYAMRQGLPVLQPERLRDPEFLDALRALHADVQVVVAFRMLPVEVWDMPPQGTYNVHASLLPAYRGAAPIHRAIIDGARESGVTVFKLRHAVDTGSVLLQAPHAIGDDTTAGELHDQLMEQGARLLVRAMRLVEQAALDNRPVELTEQDERRVTHAPKIFREDCRLDWSRPVRALHNQVRGLSPSPGAFTYLRGGGRSIHLKVLRASPSKNGAAGTNGSLVADTDGSLRARCADGWLDLLEVQAEGKRPMTAAEFLRGFRMEGGERLGDPGTE